MDGRQKKAPEEVTIRHAKNGGFIARHSYNNMGSGESYQPPDEYAFGNHKAMMTHVHAHTSRMGATAETDTDNAGASRGAGTPHGVGAAPDRTGGKPTGVAGRAKAAPPSRRTRGAGVD